MENNDLKIIDKIDPDVIIVRLNEILEFIRKLKQERGK